MADFLGLPNEMQAHILSYVIRPKDLANLCRVSKHLNNHAFHMLYKDITIDLGTEDAMHFSVMGRGHPGWKHIKILCFVSSSEPDVRDQWVIGVVLRCLPRNSLQTFISFSYHILNEENTKVLLNTQQKLESLRARISYDSLVRSNLTGTLQTIEFVGLDSDVATFDPPSKLFPKLERLHLYKWGETDDPSSTVGPGVAMLESVLRTPVFNLTELRLNDFTLRDPRSYKSLLQAIDFCRLETLFLVRCTRVAALVRGIKDQFSKGKPSLQYLEISIDANDDDVRAIGDLLLCFTGLETLLLGVIEKSDSCAIMLDSASVIHHKDTLRNLGIEQGAEAAAAGVKYPVDTVTAIYDACPHLEQLGLRALDLQVEPDQFLTFNKQYLAILSQLHKLRIFSEYGTRAGQDEGWPSRAIHQSFAQLVFETFSKTSASSFLSAVNFGCGRSDRGNQLFVRGATIDPAGGKSVTALLADPRRISWARPEHCVLDIHG